MSKPIGRATQLAEQPAATQSRGMQSAGDSHARGTATIEARVVAIERKLDALINVLKESDEAAGELLTADIRRAVTSYFGVKESEIERTGRSPRIVRIRQIAFYLCRTHTTCSLPELGRLFGDRHHSTILPGARRIAARRKIDAALDRDLSQLEARLAEVLARRSELATSIQPGT